MLRGCIGSGREAITAGATFTSRRPKARGEEGGRRRFRTDVSYLSSTPAGELCPFRSICLRLGLLPLPTLHSLPLWWQAQSSLVKTLWKGRGWRTKRFGGEVAVGGGEEGHTKHDQGGLFVFLFLKVWEGGGCRRGVVEVWKERWVDAGSALPVLMSRRRSSGPPWSAPRPPNPGRPWS